MTKTAAEMRIGQRARVVGVEGIDEITARLMEMGLTPGVEIELLGSAPFGDPLEFEVRGYRLSLRVSEARRAAVEILGEASR
ncbi:MAG: ferrous iron transport protein A [Pirellulales bacterium]